MGMRKGRTKLMERKISDISNDTVWYVPGVNRFHDLWIILTSLINNSPARKGDCNFAAVFGVPPCNITL